jgi:oligopeptide/dipeptide ABC transporter ATP-binding protein
VSAVTGGPTTAPPPLLEVTDLTVSFARDGRRVHAVNGVSLRVDRGGALAVVGESGSGKSVTALSVLGLTPPTATTTGSIRLDGRELVGGSDEQWRRVRGSQVAMVFQDPSNALNPLLPVGTQIVDALRAHRDIGAPEARRLALETLDLVRIPDAARRMDQYVHEFSGGMKQRVAIALAVALRPRVLIADEPTTALDVAVQAHVMELLGSLRRELGTALVLVTHDLGVVAQYAETIAVMYAGRVVEAGRAAEVLGSPHAPYTAGLLAATPRSTGRTRVHAIPGQPPDPARLPVGCSFADRCALVTDVCRTERPPLAERGGGRLAACHLPSPAVTGLSITDRPGPAVPAAAVGAPAEEIARFERVVLHYPVRTGLLRRTTGHVHSVDGVTLGIRRGETLAVVGESGSGKTSLARTLVRLARPTAGRVLYDGIDVTRPDRAQLGRLQREVQMVFQNPFASLDPRMAVGEVLAEPLRTHGRPVRSDRLAALLDSVGLPARSLGRYPTEFSGGQLQRIAIARALVLEPRLLVCDEAVSALDVSIQAQVLNLLRDLQEEHRLTYLFISHDLSVVRSIADRIAVMYVGQVVEHGDADAVSERPRHPYTRALLSSTPPDPREPRAAPPGPPLAGELPSPTDPPPGCRFAPRCPLAEPACVATEPPLAPEGGGHAAACLFPLAPGQSLPVGPPARQLATGGAR